MYCVYIPNYSSIYLSIYLYLADCPQPLHMIAYNVHIIGLAEVGTQTQLDTYVVEKAECTVWER